MKNFLGFVPHKNSLFVGAVLFFSIFNSSIYAANAAVVATNNNGKAAVTSLAPMLARVLPTVVNVTVRGSLPLIHVPVIDQQMRSHSVEVTPKFEEIGSGVIVSAEHGYILTNAHVIKDGQVITVTLKDGRKQRAKVVGYDDPSDIAVLKIEAKRLQQITFGDSDKINIGDFASAIGVPFGLQQTVTSGVISGLERNNLGIEGYENFIQTDAPINPGNSGGALVDMNGELIGINTAIITPTPIGGSVGLGLAIPSNMAKSVMEQLITYGKVERGVLGLLLQDVTPALAEAMHLPSPEGALITQVMPDTPAAFAGFHSKDVVIEINGKPMRSAAQVRNTISLQRLGTKIAAKVWRDNKFTDLTAATVNPEKLMEAKKNQERFLLSGLELRDFNQLIDNTQIKGVKVLDVDDNSAAYSCGLRVGDVILAAANQAVSSISDLQTISSQNKKQLLLEVLRGKGKDARIFLVLEE